MKARVPGARESLEHLMLSRREVIEALVRQGVRRLSRIKSECRRFERSWEARLAE